MSTDFKRLPVDEARPRPLVLAGLVICVLTVIFCLWQTRDKQQAILAEKPTQSATAKTHDTFVTPTLPSGTENTTSTNNGGPVRVRFSPKMEIK